MEIYYDVCVDYDSLCKIEDSLTKIQKDLEDSTIRMNNSLQESQDFLEGNQFEKAKTATNKCMIMTKKTVDNIQRAKDYLGKLMLALDEYGSFRYEEE